MAEAEDALQGADEGAQVEDPPVIEDETPEPIAKLASEMGWTPKDEWSGDPEKWKPADQFIRDGREIQQSTARELRAMREQVERLGGVTETIIKDKLAERDAEWQSRMAKAVDEGDTETALKLADQRPVAQPAGNRPDPKVAEWVAKNPWFNDDPAANVRASEVSDRLKHLPVPDQLAAVEKIIRKEFPEHFSQAKPPASVQTGAARNANPSNREKGFADMPAESQRIALDYERRLGVPKEKTAKSYWLEKEGSK